MPAIGNLASFRRTVADATRIALGPIARRNLHTRMSLQPLGYDFWRPILQNIHDTALLVINQNRAISLVLADGSIINTQNTRYRLIRFSRTANKLDQQIDASWAGQFFTQAGAANAARYQSQFTLHLSQSQCSARPGIGKRRNPFDENLSRTAGLIAEKSPRVD